MPDLLGYLAFGVVKDPFSNPIFSKLLTKKWSDELGHQLEVFLTTMLPLDSEPSLLQMYKHWIGNVVRKGQFRPEYSNSLNGNPNNSFSPKPPTEFAARRPLKPANSNISFEGGGVASLGELSKSPPPNKKDVSELLEYVRELEANNKELVEILNNSLRKTARLEQALQEQPDQRGLNSERGRR